MSIVHLVSVSGGKDSTATLILAAEEHGPQNIRAAFADTGNEHEATYDYVRYLHQRLGIPIQWLRADFSDWWWKRRDYVRDIWPNKLGAGSSAIVQRVLDVFERGPSGNPYLDLCMIKGRFPSRRAQFCTRHLKVVPLTEYAMEFLEQGHAVWSWQGIRIDESESRRGKFQGTGACVKAFEAVGDGLYQYRPILRWTARDVFQAHELYGVSPNPLYMQGMTRVGCMPCINANKGEMREISRRFPEHIDRIAAWEEAVSTACKRGRSTFMASAGDPETAFALGNIWQVVNWSKTARGGALCGHV